MSILAGVGLALIVVAAYCVWLEHRRIRGSAIVRAQVFATGAPHRRTGAPGAPEVVFETGDGRMIMLHGKLDPADGRRYADTGVLVAYAGDRPQQGRVLLFSYRYGFWVVIGALGVWLLCLDYGFRRGDELIDRLYVAPALTVAVQ
jgi:hypothetical protein